VGRRDAALAAGLAAGVAILTRPNLVPLAAAPLALLLVRAWRGDNADRRAWQRLLLFIGGVPPRCRRPRVVHWDLFGSTLLSGQRMANLPFRWSYLLINLSAYSRWLIDVQTPYLLLAVAAPIFARRMRAHRVHVADPVLIVVAWLFFVVIVLSSYL